MLAFLTRRLFYSLFVFLGVTVITFSLFQFVGGDPATLYAGKNATPEAIQNLKAELGLDRPLLIQYLDFLKKSVTFNWGVSWASQQSISKQLSEGAMASICVTLPAFVLSVLLAIFVALICVYKKNDFIDQFFVSLSLALMSLSFVVYIIYFQKWLAFDLSFFPIYGWNPSWKERWMYISLPGFIYALVHFGPKLLLFRAALMDEDKKDYVRTAFSKGLAPQRIYAIHVLKNAAAPIIALITSQMPSLITGSLLLEAYFGIPGAGGLLVKAIHSSDFPLIQAFTVVGSLFYILFNFLNDLILFFLDQRRESL